jgi:hypothetical protein
MPFAAEKPLRGRAFALGILRDSFRAHVRISNTDRGRPAITTGMSYAITSDPTHSSPDSFRGTPNSDEALSIL